MSLIEIFSSVQGEGLYTGASTLFIRFGECDLRCRWCDTPRSWTHTAECRVQVVRGESGFRVLANPVAGTAIVAAANALEVGSHRFVSLTGGEPLLQPDAVSELAEGFRGRGPRIHLETHGLLADSLARVVRFVDVVAMDWKLASDVVRFSGAREGVAGDFHAEHEEFLRVAQAAPEVMVKMVLTPASEDVEIDEMTRRIARVDREIPVIVQPVTPAGPVREGPSAQRVLEIAARLERTLRNVRVIPQTHKLYGAP
jgi:organic radical activating enzyme